MTQMTRNARFVELGPDGWIEHHGDAYRYPAYLTTDGAGWVAVVATLPGVIGRGATQAEALEDATRQATAVVREAKAAGRPIPRTDPPPPPPEALTRYVFVRLGEPG